MRVEKTGAKLTLSFSIMESRRWLRTLGQIIANYQLKPNEIDPKAASVWYSTRGCERAGMSAEETREWVENLQQFKSANVQLLKSWSRSAGRSKEGQSRFSLKLEDAPILLTALNDHRLLLAATHDIGQEEMDMRALSMPQNLKPAQQLALSEIHFLACVIEEVLQFLPGNPADWLGSQS